ncbi:MAG: CarD family transcriptional regulator [Actinomycetaceae bacterium]|nr:CarD family transcriptional regulator [Actinomycetaceae bacterium]MDY6082482.1 CarD family transcriptional regulator [Actinomycetaceae bacterium]
MELTVGATVIYPHHGAAQVQTIEDKTIRGEKRQYATLKVLDSDLVIQVPIDNVNTVGIREVSDAEQLARVFAVLQQQDVEEPSNWSRRFKANNEKLTSGDVIKIAEVIRDLTRRDENKKLSAGEKRMLNQARQILASEVALARGLDEPGAETLLDHVLAGEDPDSL